MAIKIFEKFDPRANPADSNYPYGSIKNESVPGAKDGTPLDAAWGNDYAGFDAALLAEAGIEPSGVADTGIESQRLDATKLTASKAVLDNMTGFERLNNGVWADLQEFTAYNQYMIYNGEAYSPLPTTTIPYVVGATPDLGFVYQIQLNSLQQLSGLDDPSGLDASYSKNFSSVASMISYSNHNLDQNYVVSSGGVRSTYVVVNTVTNIDLGSGLYAEQLSQNISGNVKKQTMVIFGDSITAQNTESGQFSDRGYFNWANMLLGNAFELLNNAGIGGDTTADMLARIDADVLDHKSGYVWIHAGVNDVGTTSDTSATIFARLENIIEQCIENGSIVVLSTVTPASSMNTLAKAVAYYELNQLIRDYAVNNDSVILVDFASAYNNPTGDASGYPSAITGYTIDGVHPNSKGAFAMGNIGWQALRSLVKTDRPLWATSNTDSNQFALNGMMIGTSGTISTVGSAFSGDVADDTVLSSGAGTTKMTAFKESRPEIGFNEWQSVYIEGDGSATGYARLQQTRSTITTGTVIKAYAEIETMDDTEGVRSIALILNCRDGGSAVVAQAVSMLDTSASYGNVEFSPRYGVLETPALTIPATSATNELLLNVILESGTVKLGRVLIKEV